MKFPIDQDIFFKHKCFKKVRLELYTFCCEGKGKSEKQNFGAFHLHLKVKIGQTPAQINIKFFGFTLGKT